MRFWPKFRSGWERRKEDLREELEAHLRLAVEERVTRGESPEEARAAAIKEMGNLPLVEDVTRRQWGWEWLERIGQDLRYAVRQLAKSPGYTATALITLTLAIGANTAVFGLLYALLLRSLPVAQPDRIVQVKMQMTAPGGKRQEPTDYVGEELYDALNAKQTVFSGMCGWSEPELNLQETQGARPIPAASVTGECFSTLGVRPVLGRLLTNADEMPGGGPEGFPVVLGYDYWRAHLGADPHVIGRVMHFGASFQAKAATGVVVGVMEPGFESVRVGSRPSIYVPLEMTDPKSGRNWNSFDETLLARLKDGVRPAQAQAQVDTIFQAQLKKMKGVSFYTFVQGVFDKAVGVNLLVTAGRTGYSYLRETYTKPLYLIEGMVGLSLLVACAYLALLSSARALARRRELAIRIALGASRRRVAAGLWLESVLLALAGACLGVLFAWGAERALVAMIKTGADTNEQALHTGPGGVVLLFTLAVTAFTVLVSGVLPAWRGSRLDPVSDIKEGENTRKGRKRVGAWLVPVEIGFSLVIVTIAALMGSTVAKLLAIDPGFRTSGVTFVSADFSSREQHAKKGKPSIVPPALLAAVLDRVRHTPGVQSASISQAYPLTGMFYLQSASSTLPSGGLRKDGSITNLSVTPGYFETLGIPVLRGRDFTTEDKGDAPQVCILSRSAAKFFFPGSDALGGMLSLNKKQQVRVVGVVGDTLYSDLGEKKAPRILYLPYLSGMSWNPFAKIEVHTRDTAIAVAAVQGALRDLAPDVAVDEPVTMTELIDGSIGSQRMVALLSGFFAVMTLVLSAIGMYGLLNYSVVRRRKEIGVRMALGSTRSGVVKLVAREALWMVIPGLLLGGVGAWAVTRFLRSLLFEVKPMDPWVMAASAAVLVATAILACLVPARRAAGVHPMEALRCE